MSRPSIVTGERFPPPAVVNSVSAHQSASDGVVIVACGANRSALSTAAPEITTRSTAIVAKIAGRERTSDFFFVVAWRMKMIPRTARTGRRKGNTTKRRLSHSWRKNSFLFEAS